MLSKTTDGRSADDIAQLPRAGAKASPMSATETVDSGNRGLPNGPSVAKNGKRITVVCHFGWGVHRYRLDLLRALARAGWDVIAIADWSDGGYEPLVRAQGIRTETIKLTRSRLDPIGDIRTFIQLVRIYRRLKPDVAQHFNARTFLLGAIAARLCRVPMVVNGVNGIGIVLGGTLGPWRRAFMPLYRLAFGGRVMAVFQNKDDRERMIALRIVPRSRTFCIPGSGVDTDALRPDPSVPAEQRDIVIMASRIVRSKGVCDFVGAAESLKPLFPHIRFILAGGKSGSYGMHDPDDVDDASLKSFVARGFIEWPGHIEPKELEDMYRRAAVVVLPSFYPEGVPRCLIEGAAAGAPIVTTDTPGCRDVVIDGVSGYLVVPHSPAKLAEAIGAILSTPGAVGTMGAHSRRLAVTVFDATGVNAAFLQIYADRPALKTTESTGSSLSDRARGISSRWRAWNGTSKQSIAMKKRKKIVISAVNCVEGGILSVLQDSVTSVCKEYGADWDIIVLANNKNLLPESIAHVIEFPSAKKSWTSRLVHEFFHFRRLSKLINPDVWLSLHDISAKVSARRRAVYCQNPIPFYPMRIRDAMDDWKLAAFSLLYGRLYGINIHSNEFVIVQQDWLRREFQRRYNLTNVIVAHPEGADWPVGQAMISSSSLRPVRYRFFYPFVPHFFKNAEVVCRAARILHEAGQSEFEVVLTIDGTENAYAREIRRTYGDLPNIVFAGHLERERVFEFYRASDCLIFASKLETWGLPITEFKSTMRPMLVADLTYARETVGGYQNAEYFGADDDRQLSSLMLAAMSGVLCPTTRPPQVKISAPFSANWSELWAILLSD